MLWVAFRPEHLRIIEMYYKDENKMKNILRSGFAIVSISLCVFMPMKAMAGDLNGAEQSVVSYCSGVFSYNGKSYQATSSAIASLRAELSKDGVDLSAAKAKAAKIKFNDSIGQGVAEGHMIEVGGGAVDDDSGNDKQQNGSKEEEETQTAAPDPNNDSLQVADPAQDDEEIGSPNNSADEKNSDTTNTQTPKNNDKETNNSQNEEDTKKVSVLDIFSKAKQDKDGGYFISGSMANGQNEAIDMNSADAVDQLLKDPDIYTVEAYQDGTVLVTTKDGTVLYEGEMPIKSTGLYISPVLRIIVVTAIVILILTMGAAIITIKRGKKVGYHNEGEK
jgi:hypothetical protein